MSARPPYALEGAEEFTDRAEDQLERLRQIRRSALIGLAFVALTVFLVFGAAGWGPADLVPTGFATLLLGGTGWLAIAAHREVERARNRLHDSEEEWARVIGASRDDSGEGSP